MSAGQDTDRNQKSASRSRLRRWWSGWRELGPRHKLGRRVPTRQSADILHLLPRPTRTLDRPLLTVGDRQLPVLRAGGGHGRRGRTRLGRCSGGHLLNRGRVRPERHLPRWQGLPARGAVRWDSNPSLERSSIPRRRDERAPTCGFNIPAVTVRARPGLVLPDAVRTQHGPAPRLAPAHPVPNKWSKVRQLDTCSDRCKVRQSSRSWCTSSPSCKGGVP
jgi:hypothetical protein